MKIHPSIALVVFGLVAGVQAQTLYVPGGTGGISASSTGNVGIGSSNPNKKLTIYDASSPIIGMYDATDGGNYGGGVKGYSTTNQGGHLGLGPINNGSFFESMTFDHRGNVGIGTNSPNSKLTVYGDQPDDYDGAITVFGDYTGADFRAGQIMIKSRTDDAKRFYFGLDTGRDIAMIQYVRDGQHWGPLVIQPSGGNVGIGTTNPTYPLTVNGAVRAKEVIVDTGWSDYVFDEHYKLAPLSEVESHIKAEKHLPGIPSAQEVAEKGISVGEMQAKLLAKIEELTLHQIEQEKKIAAQSKLLTTQADQLATQSAQLSAQSNRLERLEAENAALKFPR